MISYFSTFFIEYEFPVNSLDSKGNMTGCTEMIRCASNKLSNEGEATTQFTKSRIEFHAPWDREIEFDCLI